MTKQIIPYDTENNELNFCRPDPGRYPLIYIIVLVAIITMIVSLPLIQVSISVQSRGIIRPVSEIAEIRVIQSAPVSKVYISEGHRVLKGDTLLVQETSGIKCRVEYARHELTLTEDYIHDLQNLTNETQGTFFHTDLFKTQNNNYSKKISEIDFRIDRANTEVVREQPLFENRLISNKEFEALVNSRDQLENEKKVMEAFQMLQWKDELAKHCSNREGYISEIGQLEKQLELYVIKSPVSGTIESFSGIYTGCNLQSGQVVAVISPDNALIADVFVTAKNIGMLFKGMPVKIQIDAFNYNEWGIVPGQILRISDDYSLVNNIPVFKVQCSLDSPCLRLKNGTMGTIKKGMTVNARFMVAKRSLFQLIYQKSDDWLNPARNLAGIQSR